MPCPRCHSKPFLAHRYGCVSFHAATASSIILISLWSVVRWLTLKMRNLQEVYEVNDFTIAIYRVAEPKESSKQQPAGETRYIALVPEYHPVPIQWYTDETLFGLQKKLKAITVIDWEKAERELATSGFYKISISKDGIRSDQNLGS